jgi:C-terminal processing protease CtpA/Prc
VVIAQAASPVTAADWRTYEVSGEVPADAVLLAVDLGLGSGGRVWWDDLSLAVGDGPAEPLLNGGFDLADEDGGPAGWNLEWDVRRAGYRLSLSAERPRSGRYSLLLAAGAPAGPCPRPDEPLAADLGGGVSALVPLALRRDGLGTLPHVPAPAPAEGVPAEPSGNDRATRLADVVLAWNVFQHFYPYFDVVPADWPDELRRALTAAATDADRMAFLATLRRLVVALHDGHGAVSGSFQGAFAHLPLLWEWIEGRLVVTQAAPTGAGGLRPGDVVLTLDGRPAGEAVGAYEEKIPGATPQWRRWTAVSKLALGGPDAAVRITARHPDGVEISATLNHSVPAFGPGSLEETRPAKIVELRPGILYVDLDRIDDDDFQGALDRLAAARGIVFDGRGYPHGLSTVVLQHLATRPVWSARLNVPVVTRPDRQGWQWDSSYRWYLEPKAPHLAGKVAFIADGRVISYAESYLDFVEVYRLGEIVGGPTAGTSGEINPFLLPGGYRMVWTGTQVLKHDGSPHHGVGVQPTVPVARTLQGVAAERDELLEKAIEVVSR